MAVRVVIDADWFVINGEKYIKQFAFCVVGDGQHGCYSFTLPGWVRKHQLALERQSRFSHGLHWNAVGSYSYNEIRKAFDDMALKIAQPLTEITFLAKGSEKCALLESYLGPVSNLEDVGCPKYSDLICVPQTTMNKALLFAIWLNTDF